MPVAISLPFTRRRFDNSTSGYLASHHFVNVVNYSLQVCSTNLPVSYFPSTAHFSYD